MLSIVLPECFQSSSRLGWTFQPSVYSIRYSGVQYTFLKDVLKSIFSNIFLKTAAVFKKISEGMLLENMSHPKVIT